MEHTQIFQCLAGSRLYGTENAQSDWDYKGVHLPTKRDILLRMGRDVHTHSTGDPTGRNGAEDVDIESFTLQRFLNLAAQMQAIPVEMLFAEDMASSTHPVWAIIVANRDKILSKNSKAFAGYCKGQAIKYSMRGKRLDTFITVLEWLEKQKPGQLVCQDPFSHEELTAIDGVKIVPKEQPGGNIIPYLDVYGRQVPGGMRASEAVKIYRKPVAEAGDRAKNARDAGGMDCKALYHAVRIVDEGIMLFKTGKIEFPCTNLPLLREIRAGSIEIDDILDIFDEKLAILEGIGDNSPLPDKPDQDWMNDLVIRSHENIIRA